jgi:hypothetical protein
MKRLTFAVVVPDFSLMAVNIGPPISRLTKAVTVSFQHPEDSLN